MQWVFGVFAFLAILIAGLDLMVNWIRFDDLEKRVNIMDEVLTVHSEELDELERIVVGGDDNGV